MSENSFDVVVIGGGSAGYSTAIRSVQLGMTAAVIEKDKLGGTCLHRGCVPTKALLHVAEVADVTKSATGLGVLASYQGIDIEAVSKYREDIVTKKYKGIQGLLKAKQVTVIPGAGKIIAPNRVSVDGKEITAKHIVIASGSYSRSLPGLEFGGRIIDSERALELDTVPSKVIVLGGGVIGVEFASVWNSFGAEVTIVEAFDRLVPNEEPAISKQLQRAFNKRGIKTLLGTKFESASQDDSQVTVKLADGSEISADYLLVAVGRGPATSDLGLEQMGVNTDRGFVLTNENLETNIPGIYAVGDVVPGLQLAHRGYQHGIFLAEHLAGLKPQVIADVNIPKVTYCDPEIASVGLTEEKAVAEYGADQIVAYEYNLAGNAKSSILGTAGFIKLVRKKDGAILGFHAVGARVGELVGEAQLIVNWEAYPEDVAQFIHAHPTQNESIAEAALALAGKPLHSI